MARIKSMWCCGCQKTVGARLTNGEEVYPHRQDLWQIPFWICRTCKNFVGCHHKTHKRTDPLGNIATPEIKKIRQQIHNLLDPIWKEGKYTRTQAYKIISDNLNFTYHTADIKHISEAKKVVEIIKNKLLN